MVFESGKMNQITFQGEGRHLIADCFFRFWRRFLDRRPDLLQYPLNILWKARDVFIDILERGLISFHVFFSVKGASFLSRPTVAVTRRAEPSQQSEAARRNVWLDGMLFSPSVPGLTGLHTYPTDLYVCSRSEPLH